MKAVDWFISHLLPGHAEGILVYFIASAVMTVIQIVYRKDIIAGLKGSNGLWEGTEQLLYLCFWIFPQMIFSSGFLSVVFPDIAWYTILAFMAYGLTGRWGLEWLLAFKNNATSVTSTIKETKETEVTQNIK